MPSVPRRTSENPSVAPTTACVVDTGMLSAVVTANQAAVPRNDKQAFKPWKLCMSGWLKKINTTSIQVVMHISLN